MLWIIIILGNLISIAFGLNSAIRFYRAMMKNRNLMKYQGDLINAFVLIIIFPICYTLIVLNMSGGGFVGFGIEINDMRGQHGRITARIPGGSTEEKRIDFDIINTGTSAVNLDVDISCDRKDCDAILSALKMKNTQLAVQPSVVYTLPISINLVEEIPEGTYKLNLTLKKGEEIYDSVSFDVIID